MTLTSRATQELLRGVLLVGALCALGLALAALPLPLAGGLVVAAIVLLSVMAQPIIGLILLIIAVPFGSPFNIQISGLNFGPTELLFALTMAAWLGRKVIERELPPSPSPFTPCVTSRRASRSAAYFAVHEPMRYIPQGRQGKGSVVPSPVHVRCGRLALWDVSREGGLTQGERVRVGVSPAIVWPLCAFIYVLALTLTVTHSLPASLKELLKWVEVLLLILFVSTTIERKHILLALMLIFSAAAAESAVGLFQTVTESGPQPFFVPLGGRLVMRSYGTFEQPNPFAGYLNYSLPIIVSLLLGLVFEKGKLVDKGKFALISPNFLFAIAMLSLPLIVAAFFFSLSRGAWLGFAFALVAMMALRSRPALLGFMLLALAIAAVLVLGSLNGLPPAITERIADIPTFFGLNLFDPRAVLLTNENFGIVDRMAHWFAAWNMFTDFPWLGVGVGNYGVVYPQYGLREWPFSLGHAHNFYLNMLAETGLIGLAFYLVLVFSSLGFAWSVARRNQGLWRALAFGMMGALVATTVHNFFDNLYVHGMNIQFAILLGFLGRTCEARDEG